MKRLLLAMACSIGIGMAFSANANNSEGQCYRGCGQGAAKYRLELIAAGVKAGDATKKANDWYHNCCKRC